MCETEYSPFIIKSIGDFKCSKFEFDKRYLLIRLSRSSWDHCNYVLKGVWDGWLPMKWRMQTRRVHQGHWPRHGDPEQVKNGSHVHIIFLKYRTIFKCLIRLMVLKKRAQTRIIARKSLRVANLFRGVGHSNLNPHIISFI